MSRVTIKLHKYLISFVKRLTPAHLYLDSSLKQLVTLQSDFFGTF